MTRRLMSLRNGRRWWMIPEEEEEADKEEDKEEDKDKEEDQDGPLSRLEPLL